MLIAPEDIDRHFIPRLMLSNADGEPVEIGNGVPIDRGDHIARHDSRNRRGRPLANIHNLDASRVRLTAD